MTSLSLKEIQEMQPDPERPRRQSDQQPWIAKNWLSVLMFLAFGFGQIYSGGAWAWDRGAKEQDLKAQVEALHVELQQARETYVRRDVFDAVLRRIDEHLASIDQKVSHR